MSSALKRKQKSASTQLRLATLSTSFHFLLLCADYCSALLPVRGDEQVVKEVVLSAVSLIQALKSPNKGKINVVKAMFVKAT